MARTKAAKIKPKLLQAIKSGTYTSALDFAYEMGVSHATIHNYIKQLKVEHPEIKALIVK